MLTGVGEGTGVGLGVGVAVGDGAGVAVGAGVGVALGAGVGVAVGAGTAALPLKETFAGGAVMLPGAATNPKLTVPPGAIDWFHETGTALLVIPVTGVIVASQYEETRGAMSNCRDQLLIAVAPLLVTVKSPWKPEPQSCETRKVIDTDPT